MNEVATFFRNPAADSGVTYQFQVGTERGAHQNFVYTRVRGSAASFADQDVKNRDLGGFDKQVAMAVRSQGGGIVVVASGEGPSRDVSVNTILAGHYVPPERYTVLRPGYPSHSLPINDRTRINLGSHLLVPVDQESEERLQMVLSLLHWFPPDVEALVANAIRRPSLDARLAKLEGRVLGKTADAGAAEPDMTGRAGFGRQIRRVLAAPALYASAATVLLLAILGLNTYLVQRVESQLEIVKNVVTAKSGGGNQQPAAPAQQPAPTIASRTQELLHEVRVRGSRNVKLKALYDTHFVQFDGAAIDDAKAREWFNRQSSNNGSRSLMLGLIKLQMLKLKPDLDETFLTGKANMTDTKTVLTGLSGYERDATGLHLMAVLSCRLGYDSSGKPQLPTFDSSPALVLMPGARCDALGDREIQAGLDHLLQYVRSL